MTDTPTPAPSGGTESPNCQGWPGREAVDGVCCTCGYHGTEETPCPSRSDKTHCVHWWEGDGEVTPPASAPGSGEDENGDLPVAEYLEEFLNPPISYLQLAREYCGPDADHAVVRAQARGMVARAFEAAIRCQLDIVVESWEAEVKRARAEGEAKGRREALATALASAPDGPWIAFIGTKAPNGTCVRVFHKTQTHTFDLDSITTPKLHERPRGGAYDTELEGRSVCAILNLIANGDVK